MKVNIIVMHVSMIFSVEMVNQISYMLEHGFRGSFSLVL